MCTSQHVTMDAPGHEEAALTYHSRTEGRDETRLTAPVTWPLPAVSVSVSWPLPVVSQKHQQHVRGGKYTQGGGGGVQSGQQAVKSSLHEVATSRSCRGIIAADVHSAASVRVG